MTTDPPSDVDLRCIRSAFSVNLTFTLLVHAQIPFLAELSATAAIVLDSSAQTPHLIMIQSFASSDTEQLFVEEKNRHLNAIAPVTLRKLIQLNRARKIEDLAVPLGNRLEALKGDRAGFHSIRIYQQWRIVFRWTEQGPSEVQIIDYH